MTFMELGHLREAEFAGLELEDINENEIRRQAQQGLPLVLPWKPEPITLGTLFHSSRLGSENP